MTRWPSKPLLEQRRGLGIQGTTVPGEEPVTSPDLIGRDLTAGPSASVSSATSLCLRTGEGWLCLATVVDWSPRMVTGWQLVGHMRTSLVTDALAMAITHGHIAPAGCLNPRWVMSDRLVGLRLQGWG